MRSANLLRWFIVPNSYSSRYITRILYELPRPHFRLAKYPSQRTSKSPQAGSWAMPSISLMKRVRLSAIIIMLHRNKEETYAPGKYSNWRGLRFPTTSGFKKLLDNWIFWVTKATPCLRNGPPDRRNGLTGHDLEGKQGICLEVLCGAGECHMCRVMAGTWKKNNSTAEYLVWCLMAPIY